MQVSELISQACEKVGSSTKLAQMLEVPQPAITMWKNGARPCPPEDQARIGAILGMDPVKTLLGAVLERHEGTAKGAALAELFAEWGPEMQKAPDESGASIWRKRRDSNPR